MAGSTCAARCSSPVRRRGGPSSGTSQPGLPSAGTSEHAGGPGHEAGRGPALDGSRGGDDLAGAEVDPDDRAGAAEVQGAVAESGRTGPLRRSTTGTPAVAAAPAGDSVGPGAGAGAGWPSRTAAPPPTRASRAAPSSAARRGGHQRRCAPLSSTSGPAGPVVLGHASAPLGQQVADRRQPGQHLVEGGAERAQAQPQALRGAEVGDDAPRPQPRGQRPEGRVLEASGAPRAGPARPGLAGVTPSGASQSSRQLGGERAELHRLLPHGRHADLREEVEHVLQGQHRRGPAGCR